MTNLDQLMAIIGYCVSFAGAVTLVFFLIALCVDYCWRKVWDFDAIMRVCDLARKNGIKLNRKSQGTANSGKDRE